jgi:2-amino-4-hydroxy-6-hydroxymethyldihydropteridine diphosphokinase
MVVAYVGLGSNLLGPAEQVERALQALDQIAQTRLVARSRLYATLPWGGIEQPDYVNAVAELETELEPCELMQALLAIEHDFGRRRDALRFGPRVLDLDLLLYADRSIEETDLHVPHPRLRERAFVLIPLAEIAPALVVPEQGPVAQLLAQADATGCRLLSAAQSI